MCKIKGVKLGIRDLNFTSHRGKMLVRLTDGREVIVPVSFFPDIQHMPVKEREACCSLHTRPHHMMFCGFMLFLFAKVE